MSEDRIVLLPSTMPGTSGVCPALDSSLLRYFLSTPLPPSREKMQSLNQKVLENDGQEGPTEVGRYTGICGEGQMDIMGAFMPAPPRQLQAAMAALAYKGGQHRQLPGYPGALSVGDTNAGPSTLSVSGHEQACGSEWSIPPPAILPPTGLPPLPDGAPRPVK